MPITVLNKGAMEDMAFYISTRLGLSAEAQRQMAELLQSELQYHLVPVEQTPLVASRYQPRKDASYTWYEVCDTQQSHPNEVGQPVARISDADIATQALWGMNLDSVTKRKVASTQITGASVTGVVLTYRDGLGKVVKTVVDMGRVVSTNNVQFTLK